MTARLDGRIALVTGGGSGIGRASALAFAGEGATVVVADVDQRGGEETVRAVTEAGGKSRFVSYDVTKSEEVAAMVADVVATFGRLDCAHNNAGTSGRTAFTVDYPEEEWDRVMALNLRSVFLCMKHEIPPMVEQGSGAIVNTSSGAGLMGFPGLPAYVASKHGVLGLTKATALEYVKSGVRINAVCPGSTLTPMLEEFMGGDPAMEKLMRRSAPIGRLASPDEIAAAVVWLCTDDASFVVGHALAVDGGAVVQ
jgi:NAD(P)-dependent dehydrogenase (short-subunit alcohol dehydrogenase family)